MRRFRTIIVLTLVTLLFVSMCSAQQAATTAVPNLIRYGGTLKDAQGAALSSSTAVGVTFAIYKQQDGGAPVWQETQNVTPDASGQYSVILGSTTATGLPNDLFAQQEQRWLGVRVQGQDEQTRVLLVSVPYAFKAHEAETLGGLPPSAFALAASQNVPTSGGSSSNSLPTGGVQMAGSVRNYTLGHGVTGYIPIWVNPILLGSSAIYQASGGNVGIGTTTPQAKLDVNGNVNTSGSFTGGGAGLTGIQFSQLGGLLGNSQFSGSYSNPVTLSSTLNAFYGDGSHLTGVLAQPGPGSPYYIQNGTSQQPSSNFNISGNGVVNGTLSAKFVNGSSDSAQPYQINGNGVLGVGSQNRDVFLGVGTGLSDGAYNVFVGYQSGHAYTDGAQNTFVGGMAGNQNTSGNFNTISGFQAGYGNTTGSGNTVSGWQALYDNTNGGDNVALGLWAMHYNTSGAFNTAVGENALLANDNGNNNTGVGYYANGAGNRAGNNNTAVGAGALADNSEDNNTAVGHNALAGVQAYGGSHDVNNTALGYQAGDVPQEASYGSNNTFLGANARKPGLSDLDYATAVGANALVTVSNAMVLGATQDLNGNPLQIDVGVGTSAPAYILDVNGSTAARFNNTTGGNIMIGQNNGANKFRVDGTGKGFFDGGTQTGGADFAESVSVRGSRSQYEPGDVLVIDPKADRHLSLSQVAYSTLVAGIYSTKPGVLATPHKMDDPEMNSSEIPLAIVGIVPCKVTAENGPISRGDLLVTSSRSGYAMRGSDRRRMLGAVVGKALESMPKGTGVIQVLVTLQ